MTILKLMWSKISSIVIAIFIFAISALTVFFYGKQKGKQEQKAKQNEENIETAEEVKKDEVERSDDNIESVKKRMGKYVR